MSAPTVDLIDRLGAAALECRALLAEVHGATKDLRLAAREARAAEKHIGDTVRRVQEMTDEHVRGLLDDFIGAHTAAAVDQLQATRLRANKSILKAFDDLTDALFGRSGSDADLIPELAQVARQKMIQSSHSIVLEDEA